MRDNNDEKYMIDIIIFFITEALSWRIRTHDIVIFLSKKFI